MSRTTGIAISAAIAAVALLATSCATRGMSTTPEPSDLPAGITAPPWPTDRVAAADEADVLGKDFSSKSAGGTVEGNALRLTSSGGSEYVQYSFMPTGTLQDKVRIELRQPDTQGAYVAVADYSTGRWKISGPFTATAEIDLDPAKHVSPSNKVWVAVIVGFDGTAVIDKEQFFNPGWTEVLVGTTDNREEPLALAAINGRPAFIYCTLAGAQYASASTALGTAAQDWTTIDTGIDPYFNNYADDFQLLEVGGHPATFIIPDTLDVVYYRSTTPDGGAAADWANGVVIHDQGAGGYVASAVINGNPATVYKDVDDLIYVRSSTVDGASAADWTNRVIVDSTPGTYEPQLASIGGSPAIGYYQYPPAVAGVYYVRATSANGDAAADWPPGVMICPANPGRPCSLIELNGRPASHGYTGDQGAYYTVAKDAVGAQWEAPVFFTDWDELGPMAAPGGRAAFVLDPSLDGLDGTSVRASTPFGTQAADWEQLSVPMADSFPGQALAEINGKLAVAFKRPISGGGTDVLYAVLE
jgi:hypothetical protein